MTFCSAACKQRGPAPSSTESAPRRPDRSTLRTLALVSGGVVLLGVLLGVRISFDGRAATAALPQKPVPAPAPLPAPTLKTEIPFGPDPPPPDFFREGEAWFHPLAGPVRRLPERPTRRFGVARDHDSPESCGEGHCGCDIGEVKGEPVRAVHDGTVERVVLDPSARGGRYVRLLHNGGAVVTQYMHLDDVADLKPGQHVRAGDRLGSVGDTGVNHAGPHLHFTVATRNRDGSEKYIDPEPLLTLWPLY